MQYRVSDIHKVVNTFQKKRDSYGRYASFDYCYNYFHPSNGINLRFDIEKSCMSLGFYLASWGMFRGSSFILSKSAKNFEPLIEYIEELPNKAWEIDANNFDVENIEFLIEIYNNIKELLIPDKKAHLTLVTKIMLGVFGSVPAYDQFFKKTFGNIFKGKCGFTRFNKSSLKCIAEFYKSNEAVIQNLSNDSKIFEFKSGKTGNLNYTRSKIIDMYGFTKSLN